MDVLDAIRQRRSHRAFDPRPVEPEKIDLILEAATWAPSPANSQPWEFVVITSEASRLKLHELSERARSQGTIELHGYSYVRPMPFATLEEEEAERKKSLQRYSFDFLKTVPAIIAVVGLPRTRVRPMPAGRIPDAYKYACAAAIQNILLAAHSLALGSLWFTFFDQALVHQYLNLEPDKVVVALVCLGYTAGEPPAPTRYSVQSKTRHLD